MKIKFLKIITLSLTLVFGLMCSFNIVNAAESDENTEAPVIYGTNEYTISNISLLSTQTIINSLEVVDDKDTEFEIKVISDTYTENYTKPGVYYITFQVTDSDNNVAEFKVKITVNDITAPQFYNYQGKVVTEMNIFKSKDSVLVLNDIIQSLSARDKEEGIVDIIVKEDNYTGNGDKKGSYNIKLSAADSVNNMTDFNVIINVTDDMPSNTIVFDSKIIIVENNKTLSNEEFAQILKVLNMYDKNTNSYTYISSEVYTSSSSVLGEYLVGYSIQTTSGINNEGAFTVRVVEARSDYSIFNGSNGGFIMSIINAIGDLLSWILDGIIGLFK